MLCGILALHLGHWRDIGEAATARRSVMSASWRSLDIFRRVGTGGVVALLLAVAVAVGGGTHNGRERLGKARGSDRLAAAMRRRVGAIGKSAVHVGVAGMMRDGAGVAAVAPGVGALHKLVSTEAQAVIGKDGQSEACWRLRK